VYRIRVGFIKDRLIGGEWDSILTAMDFADMLVLSHGFDMARVVDERGKEEYQVEDRIPRNTEEHRAREKMSKDWLFQYQLERIQHD
jgi:hypothetical protein